MKKEIEAVDEPKEPLKVEEEVQVTDLEYLEHLVMLKEQELKLTTLERLILEELKAIDTLQANDAIANRKLKGK